MTIAKAATAARKARKGPTSYRLSQQVKALLAALAAHFGISQADVVEMAVRDLARKNKVKGELKEDGYQEDKT